MSRTKHHKDNGLFKGMGKFKKVRKRVRKAKERQAMKDQDYENIPTFKKTDKWDYL